MIKKISAILLALVLCLSVVVMPASAYELASDSVVAYVVELDKEYYSAGDTVTISLYLYGDADTHFGAGAFVFGCHSDVFAQDDNAAEDVKASATTGDTAGTFYKDFAAQTWAWQTNATVYKNIVDNNTDEENEKFDQYIKVAAARQSTSAGTHENSSNTKLGYPGSDMNAESEAGVPFVSFQLKLRDDLADGTKIEVGIPTGPMAKNYTYMDTFKSPGTATTKVKTTAANSEVVWSTDSTIGSAMEYEDSIVSFWKDQIKMENSDYTSFSIRHLAQIEASVWDTTFGIDEDKDVEGTKNITDIGFIFQRSDGFDKDAAAKWLQAGATDDSFTKAGVNFVSTGMKDGYYVFSCTITGVSDPDASLSSLGYVVWKDDAGTTHYSYFENVHTETFRELYDGYVAAH